MVGMSAHCPAALATADWPLRRREKLRSQEFRAGNREISVSRKQKPGFSGAMKPGFAGSARINHAAIRSSARTRHCHFNPPVPSVRSSHTAGFLDDLARFRVQIQPLHDPARRWRCRPAPRRVPHHARRQFKLAAAALAASSRRPLWFFNQPPAWRDRGSPPALRARPLVTPPFRGSPAGDIFQPPLQHPEQHRTSCAARSDACVHFVREPS